MKRNQLFAVGTLFTFAAASFGAAMLGGGQYDLSWHTIDGGGGLASGSNFELRGTIGQHDAGAIMTGGNFALAGGYWAGGPVDSTQTAPIFDYVILKGSDISGGLPDLEQSDDSYLVLNSGIGINFIDLHHVEVKFLANTTVNSPATIDVTIESKIDDPAGSAQVSAFNWNTNQYVSLGQYAVGLNDDVHTFPGLNGADFVSPLGEIDVKVKIRVFIGIFAYFFQTSFDQVEIVVQP